MFHVKFTYVKLQRQEIDPNEVEALRNEAEMVLQEETITYKNRKCSLLTSVWFTRG